MPQNENSYMSQASQNPIEALIVAVPETAGSALYGMVDVLSATGNLWQTLSGNESPRQMIRPRIVSTTKEQFSCGNAIPVAPEFSIKDDPEADIIILPELWLDPDDDMKGRYPDLIDWVRRCYQRGSSIYSACSGAVMLAATGLLSGREATSHWGYENLFRTKFPDVNFQPGPSLAFADPSGRIVTAGGASSWHDLALHIISRHCSPGDALHIAKAYLLKLHDEGQLPYASFVRHQPHADSAVRRCEDWLSEHYREADAVTDAVGISGIPERSLKRRFKKATGSSLIGYIQNLRIEEAKQMLETEKSSFEDISNAVGYENPTFFRRLFKRTTGLTPGQYRRMFHTYTDVSGASA